MARPRVKKRKQGLGDSELDPYGGDNEPEVPEGQLVQGRNGERNPVKFPKAKPPKPGKAQYAPVAVGTYTGRPRDE